mmetsp:Transcript_25035/g.48963  ORF Transcript_25035/g.48963 Transcript_25035/m.48963 type:complete len:227 (+) Transcript_25035:526-1206(+)
MVSPGVIYARHLVRRWWARIFGQRCSNCSSITTRLFQSIECRTHSFQLLGKPFALIKVPAHIAAESGQRFEDLWRELCLRPNLCHAWHAFHESWKTPLIESVSYTTFLKEAFHGTMFHHVRVFIVCQLVRQNRPVLLRVVGTERPSDDIRHAVCARCKMFTFGDVFPGFAVQELIIFRLPTVLNYGLLPMLITKLFCIDFVTFKCLLEAHVIDCEITPCTPPSAYF